MIKLDDILNRIDLDNIKRFNIYYRNFIQKKQFVIYSVNIRMIKPFIFTEGGKRYVSHDTSNSYNIKICFNKLIYLSNLHNTLELLTELSKLDIISISFSKDLGITELMNRSNLTSLFFDINHNKTAKKKKALYNTFKRYDPGNISKFTMIRIDKLQQHLDTKTANQ